MFIIQDLESINKMVTSIDARRNVGKRLLPDTEISTSLPNNEPANKKMTVNAVTCVSRKLENIIGERRTQNQ